MQVKHLPPSRRLAWGVVSHIPVNQEVACRKPPRPNLMRQS